MVGKRLITNRMLRTSIALLMLALTGCQSLGTVTPSQAEGRVRAVAADRPYTGTVADWPLFFRHHQFGGVCFDTQFCSIEYHNFPFGTDRATRSSSSLTPAHYDSIMTASYGPVSRTTPPARVSWRSKDGVALQTEVDISDIFIDGLIRHNVSREDIPEGISMGSTHIILEVNDRTINVYTRTMIPLKQPSIPGNKFSYFRSDLLKVYSRTY